MNIIVGATGQVGSHLISELKNYGLPVRAVVRNPHKFFDRQIETRTADAFEVEQLTEVFSGGTTVFLLTPENPASNDIIGDTKRIVENYRKAIQATGIHKIVALSCMGAHVDDRTGNILMSRMLEQELDELMAKKVVIRPSYYYSNWLAYLETAEQFGVLPTFFPADIQLDMHSPIDLAKFIAEVMAHDAFSENKKVFEVAGPKKYSSLDVAAAFSRSLNKNVTPQPIPQEKWKETLTAVGFTENTAVNLSDMTQAVIENKAVPERPDETIKLQTPLEKYIDAALKS